MNSPEYNDMLMLSEGASALEWPEDCRLDEVESEAVDHCQYCNSEDIAVNELGILVCQDCWEMNIDGIRQRHAFRFQQEVA